MMSYCHSHATRYDRDEHEDCPRCAAATYTVETSIHAVPIIVFGAVVYTAHDFDCVFVLDRDGELVEVLLPDEAAGDAKLVSIYPGPHGRFTGTTGQHSEQAAAIWAAALEHLGEYRWSLIERAGVGTENVPMIPARLFRATCAV